jgi:hypothetical protein
MSPPSERMSTEKAERIIGEALTLARGWMIVVLVAAVLSTFTVSWKSGDVSVAFQVNGVTAAILALAWLPAALRVIAWTGGSFKTAAGEASSTGFLSVIGALPDAPQLLGSLSAALDDAEKKAPASRTKETAAALDAVREQLTTAVGRTGSPVESELARLAEDYETVRRTMPSSMNRTREMSVLVEQAQAAVRASGDVDGWLRDLLARFGQLGDGGRVMALAAVRARPVVPEAIGAVGSGIVEARSPFEQYQGLRAAQSLVPLLTASQRQDLKAVVERALAGQASIPLTGSDREAVARDLLRQLR